LVMSFLTHLVALIQLASAAPSAPHIVFILNDDWGWNDVGFHGACDFETPRLDDLAATGLELTNYYVQHLCTPTRSTIMSGRYPMRDGLQQAVIKSASPYGMPLNLTILPQELQKVGYATHMIGKWHLGFFAPEYLPTARGFETFIGFYGGEEDYFTKNFTENGYNGYDFRNGTEVSVNYGYSTYIYGEETLRILRKHVDERPDTPVFMYIPMQAPHAPFQAPTSVLEEQTLTTDNRISLAAAVSVLDDTIGQIVDYLKSAESGNMWDDTILIISSDNGGDVDYEASNFPLRGTKGTLFEGGVKAIGLVNGGWLNDDLRGKQMNALMHSTDWFVTLQTIAGTEPSVDYLLDGLDQIENLKHGDNGDIYHPREVLLHNAYNIAGGIRWRDWKLIKPSEVSNATGNDNSMKRECHGTEWCLNNELNETDEAAPSTIRCSAAGNFKTPNKEVMKTKYQKWNLFNIVDDPCEYIDLKDKETEIYEAMLEMFESFRKVQAPARVDMFPENYDAANPDNFGGVWSPWRDYYAIHSPEVLTVDETLGVGVHSKSIDLMPSMVLIIAGISLLVLYLVMRCMDGSLYIMWNSNGNGKSVETGYGAV